MTLDVGYISSGPHELYVKQLLDPLNTWSI